MEELKECKKHGLTLHIWSENRWKCKKCRTEAVQKRREKLKEMAIQYKGGKCCICGYNKYQGALEFHHLNPSEKDFAISSSGYTRSWEEVKSELGKCILVCSNCHREIHAGLHNICAPVPYKNLLETGNSKGSKKKYCEYCGTSFIEKSINKYCSVECFHKANGSKRPDVNTLINDFKELKSFIQVGRKYGVSDNAVRKWCKFYNILDIIKGGIV